MSATTITEDQRLLVRNLARVAETLTLDDMLTVLKDAGLDEKIARTRLMAALMESISRPLDLGGACKNRHCPPGKECPIRNFRGGRERR